jgi:uncharacterized membrane protein
MEEFPASESVPSEPLPSPSVEMPVPTPTIPPKKSRRTPLLIGGLIVLLVAVLCLCMGLCCVLVYFCSSTLGGSIAQRGEVAKVVDAYMRAMADKDLDRAYALFSSRAQKQAPRSAFEDMLTGANFAVFDGYEAVEVQMLTTGPKFNTNPNAPQGQVTQTSGTVTYAGGYEGSFQAILEQENGEWKLYYIKVVVPPKKLEEYLKNKP